MIDKYIIMIIYVRKTDKGTLTFKLGIKTLLLNLFWIFDQRRLVTMHSQNKCWIFSTEDKQKVHLSVEVIPILYNCWWLRKRMLCKILNETLGYKYREWLFLQVGIHWPTRVLHLKDWINLLEKLEFWIFFLLEWSKEF